MSSMAYPRKYKKPVMLSVRVEEIEREHLRRAAAALGLDINELVHKRLKKFFSPPDKQVDKVKAAC